MRNGRKDRHTCMEKQNVPQRSRTRKSSMRLWTVLLIHRRRWLRRTLNLSGTIVLQTACGTNICFRPGNVFNINVDRYRSSPSRSRFFLCKVSTMFSWYLDTISGFARIGTKYPASPFAALSPDISGYWLQGHTVHGETSRKTSDTTKHRLERLC